MSSPFARCRPTSACRVWSPLLALVVLGIWLSGFACLATPASPGSLKPWLVVGPPMDGDAVYNGVTTPRFVLYTEGVALFRSGGTADKPVFRRVTVSAEQMKLFQVYMDDFFLNPEFGEGFENKAAGNELSAFMVEARYASGPVEILLKNIRMEEMEYFGSQLRVSDSLAQVPVSLLRLLSLVRQVESTTNAKLVSLAPDEKGNPVMPGVVNTAKGVWTHSTVIQPIQVGNKGLGSKEPVELPKVKVDPSSKEPEKPAPLVGPESYRK